MLPLFKKVSAIGAVLLGSLFAPVTALAQGDFPNKPIHIIVPYTAGTGGDVLSRIVADAISPLLGQPVVIDNKAGGGGMVGTALGAKAKPDGYTLTMATPGTIAIIPAMNPAATYDSERDFMAVAGIARSAYVIVTGNTAEAPRTFTELISRLKAKTGTYGTPGLGSTTHLATEVVLGQAGVKATPIPYPGTSQMLTDIASGQVSFGFTTIGAGVPLIKSERLRALAVTSARRVGSLPDVPTVAERGVPGLDVVGWWGLVAPVGTPPHIVKKLSDAIVAAVQSPAVQTRFAPLEVESFPASSAEFTNVMRSENPIWVDLVKKNKLRTE